MHFNGKIENGTKIGYILPIKLNVEIKILNFLIKLYEIIKT